MHTQRVVFSLKGTNIMLPNRYKIRRFRPGKTKSQKMEHQEDHMGLVIEAKETLPIRMYAEKIASHAATENLDKIQMVQEELSPNLTNAKLKLSSNSILNNSPDLLSASHSKIQYSKQHQPLSLLKKGRQHYSSMKTKRCTCGDCQQCLKDFAYYLHLFSTNQHLPQISAKSWCLWRKKGGKYMHYYGKRIHKVREIASLTKMITAITALDFLAKYQWNPANIYYEIKKTSTLIGGTTANLKEGQICSLVDLMYGMMLPSGNDAAIALSEAIGLLAFIKGKGKNINPEAKEWYSPFSKNYSYLFIGMMNQRCQKTGTLDTKIFNSHGNDAYDQLKNISTCNQIAKIASEFMSYPLLKEIVKTPKYQQLQNTNKLLDDGFDGIKTGITDTAGPCLAASYKDYIIVVLNSKSMNQRWVQVKKLVKWVIKKG